MLTEIYYEVIGKLLRLINFSIIVTNNEESMSKDNPDDPYQFTAYEVKTLKNEILQLQNSYRHLYQNYTNLSSQMDKLEVNPREYNAKFENLFLTTQTLTNKVEKVTREVSISNIRIDNINLSIGLINEEITTLKESLLLSYEESVTLVGSSVENATQGDNVEG